MTSSNPLPEIVQSEIQQHGPITCARFMELALYHKPYGYYRASARKPGRGGDFITAPELHPLFGLAISKQIHECWQRMGKPESFMVREYGSGIGGLAYDVLAGLLDAEPGLRSGLRYEMVELNDQRRAEALHAMEQAGLGDVVLGVEQPETSMVGVVLANELVDAMPVHRLVVRNDELRESYVGLVDGELKWIEGEVSSSAVSYAEYLADHGFHAGTWAEGDVFEYAPGAAVWISEAAQKLTSGYVLSIDYGYPVSQLWQDHRRQGTLRSYYEHTVSDDILTDPGLRDLTAHVDFTLLSEAAVAAGMQVEGLTTQADFLARVGMGELLVAMQADPDMTLDVYYRAQAAVYRLIDPGGMGNFRVLGLSLGIDAEPLTGFVEQPLGVH